MSKLQISRGTFDDTCTLQENLTANQLKYPAISNVIEYTEQRMVSTLIAAGVSSPYEMKSKPSKIGMIPQDKLVGDVAYKYYVEGRIQKASVILEQVGSSGSDGSFSLRLKDNLLYEGGIVSFHKGLQARVQAEPSGSAGNYVYNFQTVDGTTFDYATQIAPQQGEKTCFGNYTAYGERSLRGFSRSFYPDMFTNHMTIQRKTIGISGSAATDILWLEYAGQKGWMFQKERQARAQFMMENEYQKWFAKSTMKNSDGSVRDTPWLYDTTTGAPIYIGDGVISQIEGQNEAYGSASDGSATLEDIKDMMTTLVKRSNALEGKIWYIVTGEDGASRFQTLMSQENNTRIQVNMTPTGVVGGNELHTGYNFTTFNVNGNQVCLVKHPLFDDEERFTERGSDGKILQSSMMLFLDGSMNQNGRKNLEILSKGAYGVNRSMVSAYINGLTGLKDAITTNSVDGLEFNMLKEDMINIYNTNSCGILRKTA